MQTSRPMLAVLGFFILISVVGGCARSRSTSSFGNTTLASCKVDQILAGVSTRTDVEQLFGSPMSVELQGDGRRKMVYVSSVSQDRPDKRNWIPGYNRYNHHMDLDTNQQVLQVLLTQSDIVDDFEFTQRNIRGQAVVRPWGAASHGTSVSTTSKSARNRATEPNGTADERR